MINQNTQDPSYSYSINVTWLNEASTHSVHTVDPSGSTDYKYALNHIHTHTHTHTYTLMGRHVPSNNFFYLKLCIQSCADMQQGSQPLEDKDSVHKSLVFLMKGEPVTEGGRE